MHWSGRDADWIGRTAVDDKAKMAFEILVRENARMLTVYLRGLVRDQSAVDDLFQETMVVAWRRLDECDLARPFGPWLRGIAARLVMAHYRQRKLQPALLHDAVLALLDLQFESIHSQVGDTWDEKVAALHECLAALPEQHRGVVHARYLDDLTTRQVAERFQVTLEACKKRLQRARVMLAECLTRKGVLSAAEAAS